MTDIMILESINVFILSATDASANGITLWLPLYRMEALVDSVEPCDSVAKGTVIWQKMCTCAFSVFGMLVQCSPEPIANNLAQPCVDRRCKRHRHAVL
jgi:hypothetical protein